MKRFNQRFCAVQCRKRASISCGKDSGKDSSRGTFLHLSSGDRSRTQERSRSRSRRAARLVFCPPSSFVQRSLKEGHNEEGSDFEEGSDSDGECSSGVGKGAGLYMARRPQLRVANVSYAIDRCAATVVCAAIKLPTLLSPGQLATSNLTLAAGRRERGRRRDHVCLRAHRSGLGDPEFSYIIY